MRASPSTLLRPRPTHWHIFSAMSVLILLVLLLECLLLVRGARPQDHAVVEECRRRQAALERRVADAPDDHDLRLALAKVMAERRFWSEAVCQLDRILETDPTRGDAWRLRAVWCRELGLVRGEPERLDQALDSYRSMLRHANPDQIGVQDRIAASGLALALDQPETAHALAAGIEPHGTTAGVAALLLAAADYRAGRLEPAAVAIDQVREEYAGPLIDALHGLELAGLTRERHRLDSHRNRTRSDRSDLARSEDGSVLLAMMTGAETVSVVPPADGQGEAGVGTVPIAFGDDLAAPRGARVPRETQLAREARQLAAYWKSQDPTPTTPLNERFLEHCYRVVVADALFGRADSAGRDTDRGRILVRYGRPLSQSIDGEDSGTRSEPRRRRPRHLERLDEKERRACADPTMRSQLPCVSWHYRIGDRLIAFRFEDPTQQGDFHFTNHAARLSHALATRMPVHYVREVPAGLVRVAATQTRFRGRHEDVIVALAAAVPAVRVSADEARDAWGEIEMRWVVFDGSYRTVAAHTMWLDDPTCVYRDTGGRRFLLGRADFDLPAGTYVMAVEFRDHRTGKEGVVKRELILTPVRGMLSEVELCRTVKRAAPGAVEPFVRFDAQIVPNPRNEVATGDPLRFYYEIYGLERTAAGRRHCRIQHRVRSLSEPQDAKPVFPLAYSIEIEEPIARYDTYMPRVGQLDVSSLRVGRYELQVLVEDLVSGRSERRVMQFLRRQ